MKSITKRVQRDCSLTFKLAVEKGKLTDKQVIRAYSDQAGTVMGGRYHFFTDATR